MRDEDHTHVFKSSRGCPTLGYGANARISVTAELHRIGAQRPYFSVTAEIWRPKARDCDACGCLHPEVLQYWPNLAPVVALHLCDDTGAPMHAEANGWYQLAGYYGRYGQRYHAGNSQRQIWREDGTFDAYRYPTPDECLKFFAEHVRIPLDAARDLAESWRCDDDPKSTRRWFAAWLETQRPRWQQEADAAIALLDSLAHRKEETPA